MKRTFRYFAAFSLLFLGSAPAWAQEAPAASFLDTNFQNIVLIILLAVLAIFLFTVLAVFRGLMNLMIDSLPEDKRAKYEGFGLIPGLNIDWSRINRKLTDAVPVMEEEDIMLDHDYDGIKELDNHLPPWWKWMFYATIVWSIGYMGYYYVLGKGKNQYEKYEAAVAQAEIDKAEYLSKMSNLVDESNVVFHDDPAVLASGKDLFLTHCATCHGDMGEGKIGPNLTDDYWIHGPAVTDIFKTVKYGVANKMIAWQEQLLPGQMSDVTSYVMSLRGTEPPNPKEPQGELYTAEAVSADTTAAVEAPADSVTAMP